MDYQKVAETIEAFIRNKTSGFRGAVIGLSGGIDSTLVAHLAVNAIGRERVCGLTMPYYETPEVLQDTKDALETARNLGIRCDLINIKHLVDGFEGNSHYFGQKIARENLMARVRMTLLYGIANAENRIVLGTGNKSEIMIGYFTKYGDGGSDILPIGDLYKTEVWELAKHLGVSQKIIDKAPSARLSPGQTDEADIGMPYSVLDKILRGQTEDADPTLVKRVESLVEQSRHKRSMPPIVVIER